MDPRIDGKIATIGGASHTLSAPATKEVVEDAARDSGQVNQTLRHVSRTGRDSNNSCNTGLDVISKQDHSPFLIVSLTISPSCGLSESSQVWKK